MMKTRLAMKYHLKSSLLGGVPLIVALLAAFSLSLSATSCRHAATAEAGSASTAAVSHEPDGRVPSKAMAQANAPQEVNIPKPEKDTPLVDYAGVFSDEEKADLEKSLSDVEQSGVAQIVVITVKDIGNEDPQKLAARTANEWGVGDKETNNGITILIKPKTEESKGQVAIATGLGMEKALPDKECKRIIDSIMTPAFKQGKYADAVNGAIDEIMNIVM